jgi:hypothetical protein
MPTTEPFTEQGSKDILPQVLAPHKRKGARAWIFTRKSLIALLLKWKRESSLGKSLGSPLATVLPTPLASPTVS